jgi:hypothetical protein
MNCVGSRVWIKTLHFTAKIISFQLTIHINFKEDYHV